MKSTAAEHLADPNLESDFAAALERHRRELQVHCYRMLGSFEDSEDLVQETFLRAWRQRASFRGGSLRAWLYRIATNACLDVLRRTPPRVTPPEVAAAGDPTVAPARRPTCRGSSHAPRRLEPIAATEEGPGRVVVARETIELAFLAAIQHLPPRRRAVLISATWWDGRQRKRRRCSRASLDSVTSALQRAVRLSGHVCPSSGRDGRGPRRRLRRSSGSCGATWTPQKADSEALAELLREDARLTMPPIPSWYEGARRS